MQLLSLDSKEGKATLQAEVQGSFDRFEWENTANGHREIALTQKPFNTTLEKGKRNNITLKAYAKGKLEAVASLDIADQHGMFFGASTMNTPLLKTLHSPTKTTLRFNNLSLAMIEKLNWDFGDGTKQEDTKISATHSYLNAGKKIASQKILLKNGNELVITSTLNIRDPEQLGNQAINIQTKGNNTKDLELSFQSL